MSKPVSSMVSRTLRRAAVADRLSRLSSLDGTHNGQVSKLRRVFYEFNTHQRASTVYNALFDRAHYWMDQRLPSYMDREGMVASEEEWEREVAKKRMADYFRQKKHAYLSDPSAKPLSLENVDVLNSIDESQVDYRALLVRRQVDYQRYPHGPGAGEQTFVLTTEEYQNESQNAEAKRGRLSAAIAYQQSNGLMENGLTADDAIVTNKYTPIEDIDEQDAEDLISVIELSMIEDMEAELKVDKYLETLEEEIEDEDHLREELFKLIVERKAPADQEKKVAKLQKEMEQQRGIQPGMQQIQYASKHQHILDRFKQLNPKHNTTPSNPAPSSNNSQQRRSFSTHNRSSSSSSSSFLRRHPLILSLFFAAPIAASNNDDQESQQDPDEQCAWCKAMAAGPCGINFRLWRECVKTVKKEKGEDTTEFATICLPHTIEMEDCLANHMDYYKPLVGPISDENDK